jgi:tRNA splicing endonuclease
MNIYFPTCVSLIIFSSPPTAFKQQNAVHGLPLQLYPEEVTLAIEEGWAVLCGPVLGSDKSNDDSSSNSKNKKRKTYGRYHYNDDEEEEEEEDLDDKDDGYYYQHHSEENEEAEKKKKTAPWQDALAKGTPFEIPTTAEDALRAQGDVETKTTKETHTAKSTKTKHAEVHWTFPSTPEERDRYLIFKDLHSRGFRITGGSKFGSDYLLYPGDPTLYHAQFCVRIVQFKESILPALMASACRGSFQARKHLLYASVVLIEEVENGGGEKENGAGGGSGGGRDIGSILGNKENSGKYKVQYMTFGPVDGFG